MKLRPPSWLPRVLVESALIVFSVLLALVLNEWREGRAREERVAQALAAIRAELRENERLTEEALDYHTRIAESFRASQERGAELPDPDVVTQGLLAPARVLRTAWDAAQGTGAFSELPYATVLELSTVYTRQAEYEELSRSILGAAYERVMGEGFDAVMRQYPRFILLQSEFAGRERVLVARYRQALERLSEPPDPELARAPDAFRPTAAARTPLSP